MTATSLHLGYFGSILLFGALISIPFIGYRWFGMNEVLAFWAAYVLTRPLGAVVGDFLDKPIAKGGLELSRVSASAVLIIAIVVLISTIRQRAASTGTSQAA